MAENPLLNPADNILDIKIAPEGISYTVSDDNQQVILRQELNVQIGAKTDIAIFEHFFNQPELQVLSENVRILFEGNGFQLIPDELFSEADMPKVFALEHGESPDESLYYKVLPKWGVHFVFRIPIKILKFLEDKYPDAEIEHSIYQLLKKQIKRNENGVYLNNRKGAVDIIAVKDNTLFLANSFLVKTHEDICYFVLNAYEQLLLDTESFNLIIINKNAVNEELVVVLKQYVKSIHLQ